MPEPRWVARHAVLGEGGESVSAPLHRRACFTLWIPGLSCQVPLHPRHPCHLSLPLSSHTQERADFYAWRRELAGLEQDERLVLTPFEKNLEVWRQLWRVLERSDVLVQVGCGWLPGVAAVVLVQVGATMVAGWGCQRLRLHP